MNKHFSSAVKNYIVCGVLMIIVGALLLLMNKTSFGAGCIIFGVVFIGGAIGMIASGNGYVYLEDKEKTVKKTADNKAEDDNNTK